MGIRKYRGQIVCDVRWPDGSRTTRVCANKAQARQLLDRIKGSIANGNWKGYQEKLKLRDRDVLTLKQFSKIYIEEYAKARNKKRAWERKLTSLNSLLPFMGTRELSSITPALLHKYVNKRKTAGLSNSTINRDLTILKHMLTYAVECGLLEVNPVEKFKLLKEDLREGPRYTEEEVQQVINAVRPDCRAMFTFIRETGCRREEALSLEHWQVQEDSQLVVFTQDTKSRKFRYVPLTEKAIEAIHTLPRLEDCPYVFYNLKTRNRWRQCRKAWEKAREGAGLPSMQVKYLRRHYGIELAESGANMHDIQQVLGHSSVAVTEKYYAQFSPQHSSKKILRVLEGGNKTETTSAIPSGRKGEPVEATA